MLKKLLLGTALLVSLGTFASGAPGNHNCCSMVKGKASCCKMACCTGACCTTTGKEKGKAAMTKTSMKSSKSASCCPRPCCTSKACCTKKAH